jgi:sigma-B regulation protein RsbU (phosphoserine phosphatase)
MVLASPDDTATVEQFLAVGVRDYIREPFTPRLIKARLDSFLEMRRLLNQQEHEKVIKYERELTIGRQIQTTFLPSSLPEVPGWEIAARWIPARQVAGDFYDAFHMPNNRVGLVIADVSDKGVHAALFMALFRSLLRALAQQHYSLGLLDELSGTPLVTTQPGATDRSGRRRRLPSIGTQALKNAMERTNNYVANTHLTANMFCTTFFGVLDPATGQLIYINGGHEAPAIVDATGVKQRLKSTGYALGMMPDMEFGIEQTQLAPGDILMTYTDGVPDARNPVGKFFTEKGLLALLEKPDGTATAMLDRIDTTVRTHIAEADQFDDITMLAVRRI